MPSLAKYRLDIGNPLETIQTSVGIGTQGGSGLRFTDHHLEFQITKTNDLNKNKAFFKLYNLSEDSIANINREAVVIFKTGYGDGELDTCYTGNVYDYDTENVRLDKITTIHCEVGYIPSRRSRTKKTWLKNTKVREIIRDIIVKHMGLPDPLLVHNPKHKFAGRWGLEERIKRDLRLDAPAKIALDEVCKDHRLEYHLQDGDVYRVNYIGDAAILGETFVELISPETGLIGSPKKLNKNSNKLPNAPDSKFGYKLETVLNPRLVPGDKCLLNSNEFRNKVLTIAEVTHKGSWEGVEWKSLVKLNDIEAKEE